MWIILERRPKGRKLSRSFTRARSPPLSSAPGVVIRPRPRQGKGRGKKAGVDIGAWAMEGVAAGVKIREGVG